MRVVHVPGPALAKKICLQLFLPNSPLFGHESQIIRHFK